MLTLSYSYMAFTIGMTEPKKHETSVVTRFCPCSRGLPPKRYPGSAASDVDHELPSLRRQYGALLTSHGLECEGEEAGGVASVDLQHLILQVGSA